MTEVRLTGRCRRCGRCAKLLASALLTLRRHACPATRGCHDATHPHSGSPDRKISHVSTNQSHVSLAVSELHTWPSAGRSDRLRAAAMAADSLRHAFREPRKAILSQEEVGAGMVPGGGLLARPPRLMGRERGSSCCWAPTT